MNSEEALVNALVDECGWGLLAARLGVRARFRCEYCGRDLLASVDDYDAWQVEHVHPRSKDGAEGGPDDLTNLALSCKTCNFLKRNVIPEGNDRSEQIAHASAAIQAKRSEKLSELAKIRALVHPAMSVTTDQRER